MLAKIAGYAFFWCCLSGGCPRRQVFRDRERRRARARTRRRARTRARWEGEEPGRIHPRASTADAHVYVHEHEVVYEGRPRGPTPLPSRDCAGVYV